MDVGFTDYDYPETAGSTEQFEPYVALTAGLANGLSSTTTLFYETEYEVTMRSRALSYRIDLGGSLSLDLAGELGGVMPSGADDTTYWSLSTQLMAALTDQAAAYLGVTYSNTDLDHRVNPQGDEVFYLKAGVSLGF